MIGIFKVILKLFGIDGRELVGVPNEIEICSVSCSLMHQVGVYHLILFEFHRKVMQSFKLSIFLRKRLQILYLMSISEGVFELIMVIN